METKTAATMPLDERGPSAQWFANEVRAHDAMVKAYLRSSFPAIRDVEDVAQESYLRAWKAHATRPIKSAKALFFTVARRLALNAIRRERRSPVTTASELEQRRAFDQAPDAALAVSTAEEVQLLIEAVEALPAKCREIFVLRRLQGVPQKEIAERLGLSEQTVQVQAARGLCRCQEYILRRIKTR